MSVSIRPSQSWLSNDDVSDIARRTLLLLDTPQSRYVAGLLAQGNHDELVSTSLHHEAYVNPLIFARDYQATSLMKKWRFLDTTFNKRASALKTFETAELQCESANLRLSSLSSACGKTHAKAVLDMGHLFGSLMKAQQLIHRILGPVPSELSFRFGPGSTSLIKGSVTTPRKYSREIHVTPELYCYWRDICGPNWCELVENVELISGSTVSFVPKNAKTDRTIGIEPHLNIYAQLGVGGAMRERFKPWIDLSIGQERNRDMASRAQRDKLATIDFQSASDTISSELVSFLLPREWADLLDRVRSHRYIIGGKERKFHKHSSMGNGYTFELESIIFYALARACTDGGNSAFKECVSSYGDDVILPQEYAAEFIQLSEYCGFKVNTEKSFLRGSFFESCGHDYFEGVNVRPTFWTDNNPTTVFKIHNDIRRMAYRLQRPALEELALEIRTSKHLPREIRDCLIPEGYGDIGFSVEFDAACPSLKIAGRGYDGFMTKAMKYRSADHHYETDKRGLLAALDVGSEMSTSPVRGKGVYQVGRLTTFGSWDGIRPQS